MPKSYIYIYIYNRVEEEGLHIYIYIYIYIYNRVEEEGLPTMMLVRRISKDTGRLHSVDYV